MGKKINKKISKITNGDDGWNLIIPKYLAGY